MEQSVKEVRTDSKAIQDYTDWLGILNHNGWLVYKKELDKLIEGYNNLMDNPEASGEMLKNYQLIKKGLKAAQFIPKVLEIRAKKARGTRNA